MVGVVVAADRWAAKLSQMDGAKGEHRPITVEPEVETEWDGVAKLGVNVVEEYLAVLSDVCRSLCGQEFPHELGVVVLFEHMGMRAPSATAFLGERRMWDWIQKYDNCMISRISQNDVYVGDRTLIAFRQCMCGANPELNVQRYCDAMSNYGRAMMTKQLACHQPHRLSNVSSRWVAEGPWKARNPTKHVWKTDCSLVDLWMGIWFNTSKTLDLLGKSIISLYVMNRTIRFLPGLTEREFLYDANREQIREAIANANGTQPLRIQGDDYTSRAEWVRVFYNSMRPRLLRSWPRADS